LYKFFFVCVAKGLKVFLDTSFFSQNFDKIFYYPRLHKNIFWIKITKFSGFKDPQKKVFFCNKHKKKLIASHKKKR